MKRRPQIAPELTKDISLLRNVNFNLLWGSQILSQIAQNLLNFALIIRVYQLAEGTRLANVSVALLILSFGIPSIFFAAAAGVYVDHWNKKLVLVVANFLRAFLVLGYLVFEHILWMVLILTFVISTATQFFAPAEAASLPSLVSKRDLLRANSLFVFTMYASFVIGYSGSAPVIGIFGVSGPYILTAGMLAVAGVLAVFLPNIRVKESAAMPFKRIVRYTLASLLENWRLIRYNHNLSFPITQLTITQAILGVILALAPALSVAILGIPLQQSSHYLVIPAGIGLVAGVASIGRLNKWFSHTRIIAIGLIVAAAALLLLGAANQLHNATDGRSMFAHYQIGLIVAPIAFVLGYMNAIISVAAQTILQENTTDSSRGKVFGALGMMINIAATLPVFFAATFADAVGVSTVISAVGVSLFVFAIGQYLQLRAEHKL